MRIAWSLVALLALGCNQKPKQEPSPAASAAATESAAATRAGATPRPRDTRCDSAQVCLPDWDFSTLDGRGLAASALTGKVTLVLFWASWCEPCTTENGGLSGVYTRHRGQGFELVGVSRDEAKTSDDKLRKWAAHYRLEFPIVRESPALLAAFGNPDVVPLAMLFDRNGQRVWTLTGVADTRLIEDDVAALLRGEPVRVVTTKSASDASHH